MSEEIKDKEMDKVTGGSQAEEHDKTYVCSVCGKQFDHILALAAHQMEEHPESDPIKFDRPKPDDMLI